MIRANDFERPRSARPRGGTLYVSQRPRGLGFCSTFALSRSCASAGDDAKTAQVSGMRVQKVHEANPPYFGANPLTSVPAICSTGPAASKHQPHGPFKFVEEDLNGTNPKFVVRDRDKVKWTVKLGIEARPETVASRLVWAVGYFTNEDYFLQDLQVEGMPPHLKRGGNQIGPGGSMHAVRLKRHLEDQKKIGNWKWRDDALAGTRELNGLKVMMALINNWDLKDENNEVYGKKDGNEQVYMVSDLGRASEPPDCRFRSAALKGISTSYIHSKFIGKISAEYVDFRTPSRPALIYVFNLPRFI